MQTTLDQIWDRGDPVQDKSPDTWRQDTAGQKIRRGSYGTRGKYGWEIDHKTPKSKGGGDGIDNLQPRHWRTNHAKAGKRK